MPVSPTYPGIYIQEAPNRSHTIISAPTNVAVFIGYSHPLKTDPRKLGVPTEINGFADYQREFGGFVRSAAFTKAAAAGGFTGVFADLAVAVNQFFLNGGTDAFIVSANKPTFHKLNVVPLNLANFQITATEVTDERFQMTLEVRPILSADGAHPFDSSDPLADLKITYGPVGSPNPAPMLSPPSSPPVSNTLAAALPGPGVVEVYRRVSLKPGALDANNNPTNANYILTRLSVSNLIKATLPAGASSASDWGLTPVKTYTFTPSLLESSAFFDAADFIGIMAENSPLDKLPIFNLMVIPGIADNTNLAPTGVNNGFGALILSTATAFSERKHAFLVVDPPPNASAEGATDNTPGAPNQGDTTAVLDALSNCARCKNAAVYFPYLLSPDPLTGSSSNLLTGLPNEIPPAATVAGVYAATDLARGVWKAPAGFQATTNNVTGVVNRGLMADPQQGTLNPVGINCLRQFPNVPVVVFGARTLAVTFDQQWTYVPVRRMALFLEQTLLANLKWVIFEPNSDPLWAAITMSIKAFMLGLFKQGAFQGTTPSDAYRVQCDSQTTSQADIDAGIVNIVVSFAPLKPAEFVVITIAQLAGQAQT
jgi:uncharacterized protein